MDFYRALTQMGVLEEISTYTELQQGVFPALIRTYRISLMPHTLALISEEPISPRQNGSWWKLTIHSSNFGSLHFSHRTQFSWKPTEMTLTFTKKLHKCSGTNQKKKSESMNGI